MYLFALGCFSSLYVRTLNDLLSIIIIIIIIIIHTSYYPP